MSEDIVVITDQETTIVELDGDPDTVVISDPEEYLVLSVSEQGPPGPQGIPGSASDSIEINFAYGDASPLILANVAAGKIVYEVAVHIIEAFDGVGAALMVGDVVQADRLMSATENDPSVIGSHTTAPAYQYVSAGNINLSITPGAGASAGKGLLTMKVQQ